MMENLIMPKNYAKQFILDSIHYYHDHKNLNFIGCANNLGISHQPLSRWQKEFRESGDLSVRDSGNFSSDEEKEIACLKRELRDIQNALDMLKKDRYSWKMTQAIFQEASEKVDVSKKKERRVSVSGMLRRY
jgi:transposase